MGSLAGRTGKKLIAWSRWVTSADGIGPDYCGVCQSTRHCTTKCGACPEPQLLPDNLGAVRLYCAAQTQWRYASTGMGAVRVGLDYPAVDVVAKMIGLDDSLNAFYGLQEIEREMLRIDAERAARDKK